MTTTINKAKLLTFYSGTTNFKEIADTFISFNVNLFPYEATDAEIIELAENLGIFSFLNNDSEDIYSFSDGSPLE